MKNIIQKAKALRPNEMNTYSSGRITSRPPGKLYEMTLAHYAFSHNDFTGKAKPVYALCVNYFASAPFQLVGLDKEYREGYNKKNADKIQVFDNANDFINALKKL